jgi:hypothetical protein
MSVRTALERVIVVLVLLVPGFAHGAPAYDPLAVPEGRPE